MKYMYIIFTLNITVISLLVKAAPSITCTLGDITKSNVECIVNAANPQLEAGGGVCGAIFAASGYEDLQKACSKFPLKAGIRCKVGHAKLTSSFKLKAQGITSIIHAVGPDCRIIHDINQQDRLLRNCYRRALTLASSYSIKSIAFPLISSAIYAFPKERAVSIAIEAVEKYVKDNETSLETINFVLFSQSDYDLFCRFFDK